LAGSGMQAVKLTVNRITSSLTTVITLMFMGSSSVLVFRRLWLSYC
jgi:hypothetical protein